MDLNKELMSKLLELDDVDAVYTDQKWFMSRPIDVLMLLVS